MNSRVSKELKRCNYLFGETSAVYHEMYVSLGLSDSAAMILYAILEHGGSCPLKDVCRFTGLSKQTVTSALRKLEAEGSIYLQMSGSKNKTVCFTESGQALAERTAGRVIEAENQIFASWTKEDVETYLNLMEVFLKALKEKGKDMEREFL